MRKRDSILRKQKNAENWQSARERKNAILRDKILNQGRIDLLAALLGYTIAAFHLKLLKFKFGYDRGKRIRKFTLVIGPRGFGKSTILNIILNVWRILKNPNVRILIASKTQKKASAFLHEIKAALENERIVEIFGDQVGTKWEEGSIIVKTRTVARKEPTVSTTGWDSQIASGHYDALTVDDVVDQKNSQTENLRSQMQNFVYKTLLPTLEPDGEFDVLGTRYHHADYYGYAMRKDPDFSVNTYIQSCFDKNGNSVWPEKFPIEWLLKKKKAMGSIIFESQYEGQTDKMVGKIFNWDMFRWTDKAPSATATRVWQGVDLAIGDDSSSSKFAHVTVFHDHDAGKWFVVDAYEGRHSFTEQTAIIVDRFEKYDPIRAGIESNGYQKAQYQSLRDSKDERERRVRAKPVQTIKDKIARAWKLTAEFERGDIIFLEGVCDVLAERLLEIDPADPKLKGKDLFDALDIAIQTSKRGVRKKREREPGVI